MGRETVIRIKREDGFTVLPNSLLRDDRLSLKTKGLFCMMLSFPGDWAYSIGGLVSVCGAGRDAIRGALRELEAAGYLDRERVHSEDGRFSGMVYTLHEISSIPQTENPPVDAQCAPLSDFPRSEKPTSENPTLQNKDYINTPYTKVDLSGKVDKVEGKQLSTEDYTTEEKAKLAGLTVATDAEVTEMLNEVFGTEQGA